MAPQEGALFGDYRVRCRYDLAIAECCAVLHLASYGERAAHVIAVTVEIDYLVRQINQPAALRVDCHPVLDCLLGVCRHRDISRKFGGMDLGIPAAEIETVDTFRQTLIL